VIFHTLYYTKKQAAQQGFSTFFIYNVSVGRGSACGKRESGTQDVGRGRKTEKNMSLPEKKTVDTGGLYPL